MYFPRNSTVNTVVLWIQKIGVSRIDIHNTNYERQKILIKPQKNSCFLPLSYECFN